MNIFYDNIALSECNFERKINMRIFILLLPFIFGFIETYTVAKAEEKTGADFGENQMFIFGCFMAENRSVVVQVR